MGGSQEFNASPCCGDSFLVACSLQTLVGYLVCAAERYEQFRACWCATKWFVGHMRLAKAIAEHQEFWEWVDRTQRYDPPPSLPPSPSSSSFMCCCCCRHADLLATDISAELCIKYIDRFLMFYIATAERLQRTSAWMDKLEGGVFFCIASGDLCTLSRPDDVIRA